MKKRFYFIVPKGLKFLVKPNRYSKKELTRLFKLYLSVLP